MSPHTHTHILTHGGPAAAKTCPYYLLGGIFMHMAVNSQENFKAINLNVLNFTVVLKLCESIVVSA